MEGDNLYYFPAQVRNFFVGGAVGGLLGCGAVYLLNKAGIKSEDAGFPLDYIEFGTAFLGAIGNIALTQLRHNNIDRNPGNLIREDGKDSANKIKAPTTYNFEGIASCVKVIAEGIENRGIEEIIYGRISQPLRNDDTDIFHKSHSQYAFARDGYLVNQFGVFDSFQFEQDYINPKLSLDDFFITGHKLHKFAVDRLNREAGKLSGNTSHSFSNKQEHSDWYTTTRALLEREFKNAQNIALWINYLSHREGIVGNKVRERLSQFGISNVDLLPDDVGIIEKNILRLYDSWESKQLVAYSN